MRLSIPYVNFAYASKVCPPSLVTIKAKTSQVWVQRCVENISECVHDLLREEAKEACLYHFYKDEQESGPAYVNLVLHTLSRTQASN